MPNCFHPAILKFTLIPILLCLGLVVTPNAENRRCAVADNPVETFGAGDDPVASWIDNLRWKTPWGYGKLENASRSYPLVVIGDWGEADQYFTTEIRQRYPAFFVTFSNKRSVSGGETLAVHIDRRMADQKFRIDTNRVYLTGWSAGGSGSTAIAQGMLNRGKFFAAINRVAGQSAPNIPDGAMEHTAVWYHVGLHDEQVRIDIAREAYANYKNHPCNSAAVESTYTDSIYCDAAQKKYVAHNKVLTLSGIEVIRYTEYPDTGHSAYPICYSNPCFFEWFFERAICSEGPPALVEPARTGQSKHNVGLTFVATLRGLVAMHVFGPDGRRVFSDTRTVVPGEKLSYHSVLGSCALSKGIYLIQIKGGGIDYGGRHIR